MLPKKKSESAKRPKSEASGRKSRLCRGESSNRKGTSRYSELQGESERKAGLSEGDGANHSKKTKKIGSRKVAIGSAFCIDYYEYPGKNARPKTNVSWFDASSKCGAKGKRLCSNSEWRSACGSGRKYPYGNEWDAGKCNTMSSSGKPGKSVKRGKSESAKPAGPYDMSGNVSEWTSDKSANGGNAVQDGDTASCYRSASRSPGSKSPNVGFRCCADPE